MNPHFIFNSLNSVQSLVNNNENITASKYIRIFSDLIRQNMSNVSNETISLRKEMNLVENYLKIEKLRFKDKLNYSIKIDAEVETELIMIPPLLVQPLVENAIKHGIWPLKSTLGIINIDIYEIRDELFIDISDNGVGFNSEKKSDTQHESFAMKNIYQRIEQLSAMHEMGIELTINELYGDIGNVKGTKSSIKFRVPHY